MANGSVGMSGRNYDAFVSSQRTFNDTDWTAKLQEKYWLARQKFLSKVEKKEDACVVLSDTKLDSKLQIYKSIDCSCARLTHILENYQNCLFVFANEENALGIFLKECGKYDKTKAGKIMSITGKSLTQSSHERIRLYMPLLRLYQEMDTFHTKAIADTSITVAKLEDKRSQYRASLLWMKDISEKLDPDVYRQLDKFRRVQNQVRSEKKAFDSIQMDVVQKIDLLMASRCNLMNQILAPYQAILMETFEKCQKNFKSLEDIIKQEDIYEYEFKALKQLNPLQINDSPRHEDGEKREKSVDLLDIGNSQPNSMDTNSDQNNNMKLLRTNINENLLDIDGDEDKQVAQLLEPSEANKNTDIFAIWNDNPKNSNLKQEPMLADLDLGQPIAEISNISLEQQSTLEQGSSVADDVDLMGEYPTASGSDPPVASQSKPDNIMDLLTNELDDIDNSSYFKSLQNLQI